MVAKDSKRAAFPKNFISGQEPYLLNPKTAGQIDAPPFCGFSKNVSSKERVKPWLFVTSNIIISHIFPENFIEGEGGEGEGE